MAAGYEENILAMVLSSGPVVKGVLIILVILSIWSWTITFAKILQLKRAKKDSNRFSEVFWESRNLSRIHESSVEMKASPLVQVFGSGYQMLDELIKERDEAKSTDNPGYNQLEILGMALKRAEIREGLKLEKGVTFLATVASAAPFIGLFGTVWGIMNAFSGLSSATSTTLQAVAPGISEALIATAIGLAAAIPAAIAYNYFVVAIKNFKDSMEGFSSEFLSIAARFFVS